MPHSALAFVCHNPCLNPLPPKPCCFTPCLASTLASLSLSPCLVPQPLPPQPQPQPSPSPHPLPPQPQPLPRPLPPQPQPLRQPLPPQPHSLPRPLPPHSQPLPPQPQPLPQPSALFCHFWSKKHRFKHCISCLKSTCAHFVTFGPKNLSFSLAYATLFNM